MVLGTSSGAELDLFVHPNGKGIGFEFKVADAPKMTKSLGIVLKDLRLNRLIVVSSTGESYLLLPQTEVMSLESALAVCGDRARR